jgi:hypothetical protein
MNQKNFLQLDDKNQVEEAWNFVKENGILNNTLIVKNSKDKGLGVFTTKKIEKGEIIEFCHAIVLNWKRKYVHDQGIIKYAYWSSCKCDDCVKHGNTGMILLGNGSIYNSSESQDSKNAEFRLYPSLNLGIFTAEKDIPEGEEILTWWGENYYNSWCNLNEQIK